MGTFPLPHPSPYEVQTFASRVNDTCNRLSSSIWISVGGTHRMFCQWVSLTFADIRRMVKVRCPQFNQDRRRTHWNKYRLFCVFPKWLRPFYHFQLIPLSFFSSCLTSSSHSTPLALLSWKIPYSIWIKPCTSWSDPIADPALRGGEARDLPIPSNFIYHVNLGRHLAFLHYMNHLHSNRWFY